MSSKIGLIISMIFVSLFFFLGVDLITIQFYYSDLDSKSVTISYYISKESRIDDEFISYLSNKYNVQIDGISQTDITFGDVVDFNISKQYKPIIVSNNPINIKIKRSAVIGYYG